MLTLLARENSIPFLSSFGSLQRRRPDAPVYLFPDPAVHAPAHPGVCRHPSEVATGCDAPERRTAGLLVPHRHSKSAAEHSRHALCAFSPTPSQHTPAPTPLSATTTPCWRCRITSKYKGDVEIDRATGGALAVVLILLMVVATLINNYFTKRNTKGRDLV